MRTEIADVEGASPLVTHRSRREEVHEPQDGGEGGPGRRSGKESTAKAPVRDDVHEADAIGVGAGALELELDGMTSGGSKCLRIHQHSTTARIMTGDRARTHTRSRERPPGPRTSTTSILRAMAPSPSPPTIDHRPPTTRARLPRHARRTSEDHSARPACRNIDNIPRSHRRPTRHAHRSPRTPRCPPSPPARGQRCSATVQYSTSRRLPRSPISSLGALGNTPRPRTHAERGGLFGTIR
ncbi:hypothetical protein BC628DRAFT_586712 [Trametes gibbosa]|nr:hypothetical protein BC628DRAFT_586712 [Trametes gibbosa]